jgi:hypothetical protein
MHQKKKILTDKKTVMARSEATWSSSYFLDHHPAITARDDGYQIDFITLFLLLD